MIANKVARLVAFEFAGLRGPSGTVEDPRLAQRIEVQERRSIRLAGLGQAIVAGVFAIIFAVSGSWPLVIHSVMFALSFCALGLFRVVLVRRRHSRVSFVYLIVAAEAALLTLAILWPNPFSADPWPRQAVLRLHNDMFFMFLIAVSAFSYRPSVVLWTAACCAIAWGIGTAIIYRLPDTVTTASLTAAGDTSNVLARYLLPNYFSIEVRVREIVGMLLLGALLATAVLRARQLVAKEFAARGKSQQVERLFGRFLPTEVVSELVGQHGGLDPRARIATIMVVDIENFTGLVEQKSPSEVFAILSDFFDESGRTITRAGGVVYGFQGDALMAAFNLPSKLPRFEACAIAAAEQLLEHARTRTYGGTQLNLRVGLATGRVMAGIVGREGRLEYTIYGDAVNTAARLQALAKDHNTRTLVCGVTAQAAGAKLRGIGSVTIRGRQASISAYATS